MVSRLIQRLDLFISSPSDVNEEREIIVRVIEKLNRLSYIKQSYLLYPLMYENEAPPIIGLPAQTVVDNYMAEPEDCYLFICIFWSRFGTPFIEPNSQQQFNSGTEYEFMKAYNACINKGEPHIFLYRKTSPNEFSDQEQISKINTFFQQFHSNPPSLMGLYKTFENAAEFEEIVYKHIEYLIVNNPPQLTNPKGINANQLPTLVEESRRIDAAVAQEVSLGQPTEIRVQISLPSSTAFRDKLPLSIEHNFDIHQDQIETGNLAVAYSVDKATGKVSAVTVKVILDAPDFQIVDPIKYVWLTQKQDSGMLVFIVIPKRIRTRSIISVSVKTLSENGNDILLGSLALQTQITQEIVNLSKSIWNVCALALTAISSILHPHNPGGTGGGGGPDLEYREYYIKALCDLAFTLRGSKNMALTQLDSAMKTFETEPAKLLSSLVDIIEALILIDEVDRGLELFVKYELGKWALNKITPALVKVLDLDELINFSNRFSDDDDRITYLHEIALVITGNQQQQIIDELSKIFEVTDAENKELIAMWISEALTKSGEINEAVSTAKQINDTNRREQAFLEICQAQVASGALDGALSLIPEIKSDWHRDTMLDEIVKENLLHSELERALYTTTFYYSLFNKGISLLNIAKYELSIDLLSEETLHKILLIARGINSEDKASQLIRKLITILVKTGRFSQAKMLSSELQQTTSNPERDYSLMDIAEGLALLKRTYGALEIVDLIILPANRFEALRDVVAAVIEGGSISQGIMLAQRVENTVLRADCYRMIIKQCVSSGWPTKQLIDEFIKFINYKDDDITGLRFEVVQAIVQFFLQVNPLQALQIARSLSDNYISTLALLTIAREINNSGSLDETSLWNEIFSKLALSTDPLLKTALLSATITSLIECRKSERAFEIAKQLDDKWHRSFCEHEAILAMLNPNQQNLAVTLIHEIEDRNIRAKALYNLIQYFDQQGNTSLSLELLQKTKLT